MKKLIINTPRIPIKRKEIPEILKAINKALYIIKFGIHKNTEISTKSAKDFLKEFIFSIILLLYH